MLNNKKVMIDMKRSSEGRMKQLSGTKWLLGLISMSWATAIFAQAVDAGSAASLITNNIASVTKLITAGAYVTGAAMFFIAIFQFRQHKENPTQTPLSKPMMFIAIAAALLFFPTLVTITEGTIFGQGAKTASARGTLLS
jgi:uncharacterized membrane-anchored protein